MSTLLDRAKGSALDIITHHDAPAAAIALISPRAQQNRRLEFLKNSWQDIMTFSEFNSGQLPLLRTLEITSLETFDLYGQPTMETFPFLDLFDFPNLTTFELCVHPTEDVNIPSLFNFLKTSPLLRTVGISFTTRAPLRNIPQEEVLILPNVETFSLYMRDTTVTRVFEIAARMSCPRARDISLMHDMDNDDMTVDLEIFPTPASWSAIVRQYATGPIEEAKLEINPREHVEERCSLTFWSPDTTALRLAFDVSETGAREDELAMSLEDMGWEALSQAFTTIRNHPLLFHIKRLHIEYRAAVTDEDIMIRMVGKVRELFGSLRPLDELTIHGCDLHIFLPAFLDGADMELLDLALPIVFPRIKELKILHPMMEDDEMECMNAIVRLAKAQHALGIPFERVMVRMWMLPVGMARELRRWVDVVDCREAWYGEE